MRRIQTDATLIDEAYKALLMASKCVARPRNSDKPFEKMTAL